MKKKLWITFSIIIIIAAVLFIPVPTGAEKDGGTRTYTALAYKVVKWNRMTDYGNIYSKTRTYMFPDNFRSTDDLWLSEKENVSRQFKAVIIKISGDSVLVKALEKEKNINGQFLFSKEKLEDIGAGEGDTVLITFKGEIAETFPAQIEAVCWEKA